MRGRKERQALRKLSNEAPSLGDSAKKEQFREQFRDRLSKGQEVAARHGKRSLNIKLVGDDHLFDMPQRVWTELANEEIKLLRKKGFEVSTTTKSVSNWNMGDDDSQHLSLDSVVFDIAW